MDKKQLKILMVLHMPWDANLGGPKPQMELAKEFSRQGHIVEKFDYYDAFPEIKSLPPKLLWLYRLFMPSFSQRAKEYIQKHANFFDIIDAQQGNLPFSKEELKFNGTLIVRSVGLYAFHQQFQELVQKTWNLSGNNNVFKLLLRKLRKIKQKKQNQNYLLSFQKADGIILINSDELAYVRDVLNLGDKSVYLPNGLTEKQHQDFFRESKLPKIRLMNQQIVFVGSWGNGKGARDWPAIINKVRNKLPFANFLFLGTSGYSRSGVEGIMKDLNYPSSDCLRIVPSYKNANLPTLLSEATVGAFPSYIEGFPTSILEKLASGLPVIAYDIPGTREALRRFDNLLLVPAGDVEQFSQKLINLLCLDETSYTELSKQCVEVAQSFDWSSIANETLNAYHDFRSKQ
ncbi:slr1066 [Synechocystis sp. PCC 6803]|uniref:Slr1066 protein n=1 Tax=Synechocystis sp. (strain ATCC 27184 / PCC 6803 / Kazusa) TaxID=1111708 RepID=P72902_SYNY3|nr:MULTISPECIES: glycosyltransferase family 4 protein [unclassified Synechocystis]AGF50607.1 hypothetical protein MYO_13460 [Synechocystis sp. PCC 6803]ALJ66685.1 hypothetical protein AOY38_01765 [Synechocystis sp. PCC 6803]AVP88528.1 glycosyltransferase family 1 protein [Synechocystis sp. IPPAS B-1465]MBD2617206.1 glycosyltransferase family 4 protein [Synechocystis sp. FACHB-898]MBD2638556.1 glycosyltransferase family 4 protein [Synechocystis sp. FACHB-908]